MPTKVPRLGPYLLLERLAPYGMVQPYVARRDGGTDLLILKRLLPQLAEHPTAPRRFEREARLTHVLNNRHLVRTIDIGYAGKELYMVTELVAGVRLDILMHNAAERGRPLPIDVVLGIALRVLDGLAHAHAAAGPDGRPLGLVHRDLNPRSVTVAFNGGVKLGDFGVARSQWDADLTAPGTTVGTLAYLSPEQVGQGELDARTDIYGFSVVLYELLTGGPMIEAKDALSMLRQIKDVPPVSLAQRRPDLPSSLVHTIERGLAKPMAHRWPDARSYEKALQDALQAVAPVASMERLGAFVRARLPRQEARFAELLNRVHERATSTGPRSTPSARPVRAAANGPRSGVTAPLPRSNLAGPRSGVSHQSAFELYAHAPVREVVTDSLEEELAADSALSSMPGPSVAMSRTRGSRRPSRRSQPPVAMWLLAGLIVCVTAVVAFTAWSIFIGPLRTSDLVVITPQPEAIEALPAGSIQDDEAESSASGRRIVRVDDGASLGRQLPGLAERMRVLRQAPEPAAFDAMVSDVQQLVGLIDADARQAVLRDLAKARRDRDVNVLGSAVQRLTSSYGRRPKSAIEGR